MNNRSPNHRRIVIVGGTGQLGSLLASGFYKQGHSVSTISRFPKAQPWPAIHWDANTLGPWAESLERCDAVINLAGKRAPSFLSIGKAAGYFASRLRATELLAEAIDRRQEPPRVWVNAGSISAYPPSGTETYDEAVAADIGFTSIEEAALRLSVATTRVATFRAAPVLHPSFGLFSNLFWLARKGFGGAIGAGDQHVSWIHFVDFVRAVEFLIENETAQGLFNLTAPDPLPNYEFMGGLRDAWSLHHFGLGLPAWLFRSQAGVLGVDPRPCLESRRVTPRCLLAHGFWFDYPEWPEAAADLISRWKALHYQAPS